MVKIYTIKNVQADTYDCKINTAGLQLFTFNMIKTFYRGNYVAFNELLEFLQIINAT